MSTNAEQCRLYRQRLRIRAFSIIGWTCKQCGTWVGVELCHIVATELNGSGRGQAKRYMDAIRHPECYISMCRDCHEKYDRQNGEWGGMRGNKCSQQR